MLSLKTIPIAPILQLGAFNKILIALGLHGARCWLWRFWLIIPFVNLFASLILIVKATHIVQAAGIPTTWYGVDEKALETWLIENDS